MAFLRATGQHRRRTAFGELQRQREMQECVIRARATEGACQHKAGRAKCERPVDCKLPIGLVLLRGRDLARTWSTGVGQSLRHGIELADPELGHQTESGSMADAGIGGDHATARNLRVETGRADKVSAEKDGKAAHARPSGPGRKFAVAGSKWQFLGAPRLMHLAYTLRF